MEKIYGFKDEDLMGLSKFLKEEKYTSLKDAFIKFSVCSGKAEGTVRNMYYALAKKSSVDETLCSKYCDGKPIRVKKNVYFNEDEERKIVHNVLLGIKEGKSARSVINEMANGDIKTALRIQNKFRNSVKNRTRIALEEAEKIEIEYPKTSENKNYKNDLSELQIKRLKDEINGLVTRISEKTKRENEFLKARLRALELENNRLNFMLYGNKFKSSVDRIIGYNTNMERKNYK